MITKFPKERLFEIAEPGPGPRITLRPVYLRDLSSDNIKSLKRTGINYLKEIGYKTDPTRIDGVYTGLTKCSKGDCVILTTVKKEVEEFGRVPTMAIKCNEMAERDARNLRDFVEGEYRKYFPED